MDAALVESGSEPAPGLSGGRTLGCEARACAETRVPRWRDIATEDLLPIWQAAAR